MNRSLFSGTFSIGAVAVLWVAYGFLGINLLALLMTLVVAAVYLAGAVELREYRQDTESFGAALAGLQRPPEGLARWIEGLPASLQTAVQLRVEGARVSLPAPALAPYLVGLLVMLGMLGTFLGMVVTLNGAVFALEGTADLQAIRSAFAVPIKGLGLSFGTSVAGVAASAMLGLMVAIVKRERLVQVQVLDRKIAGVLRQFTATYQREQSLNALQAQSQALPRVAEQMQSAMLRMEALSQQLNDRLQANQDRFHSEAKEVYTGLAQSVDQSLRTSVAQSANLAAESIKPVVVAAMAALSEESALQHSRMVTTLQGQLDALTARFSAAAGTVTEAWRSAVANQDRAGLALLDTLGTSLDAFTQGFERRAVELVRAVQASQTAAHASQASQDALRLTAWMQSIEGLATAIRQEREQAATATLVQQQELSGIWLNAAKDMAHHAQQSATQIVEGIVDMGHTNEEVARSRLAMEATWADAQRERMEAMISMLQTELLALREEESQRGRAAVDRLAELQADVAAHLEKLGTSLEAPIARLIETASEAPRAAADVIGKLRQEVSNSVARDNELLEERARILTTLNGVLAGIHHASLEQRAVIDALVTSSAKALDTTSQQFADKIELEAGKLEGVAAHVTSSAVDVAALSDTLGFSMRSFNDANDKLIGNLQRIEGALGKSMARSDDQLAYYVAQAREIIDLSVMAQKEMVEAMQRMSAAQARAAEGIAG